MTKPARRHFEIQDRSSHTLRWVLPRFALALLLCIVQLLRVGFHDTDPFLSPTAYTIIEILSLAGLAAIYLYAFSNRSDRLTWLKRRWREPVVLLTAIAAQFLAYDKLYVVAVVILAVVLFTRIYIILTDQLTRPGLLFISSFLILILCGTLMLKLPAATPIDAPLSWLDSLFTSTSAVCVTGLIVRDTATEFTHLGQIILLILIQLGGLGIILFGSLFAVMFGGSITLRQAASIGEVVESAEGGLGNVDRLVAFVVFGTLLTEAIGAILIYWLAPNILPAGAVEGREFFSSVFLSISAFCNAGFAPFSNSLADYDSRFTVHILITILIVIGGLGFPALHNLYEVGKAKLLLRFKLATPAVIHRHHLIRLTLHTKIVLVASAALYLVGTLGLFVGQIAGTPDLIPADAAITTADRGVGSELANASFMSVSARTAGFNSLPMEELAPTSRAFLLVLMFVGGSPGSTAGGVKTIVLAVLILAIWSTIRGRSETEAFGRSIPYATVRRAGVAASLGILAIATSALALTLTEAGGLELNLFEAVSACSTVGLSLGTTAQISAAGKIVIILSMFLGRIGPLAVIGVIAFRVTAGARRAQYHYPEEPIIMG